MATPAFCRVVFNIKGNDHRLVVEVAYVFGAVYVKFVGAHAEYDAIAAQTMAHLTGKEKKP